LKEQLKEQHSQNTSEHSPVSLSFKPASLWAHVFSSSVSCPSWLGLVPERLDNEEGKYVQNI